MQFISHSGSTRPSSRMHLQPHGARNDVRAAVTGKERNGEIGGKKRKRQKRESGRKRRPNDGIGRTQGKVAEGERVYSHMVRIRGVGRNCSTIQRLDRTLLGTPSHPSLVAPLKPPRRDGKEDGNAPARENMNEAEEERRTTIN